MFYTYLWFKITPSPMVHGMTGPPNFAVGPVALTAILYPQPADLWIYVTRAAYRKI